MQTASPKFTRLAVLILIVLLPIVLFWRLLLAGEVLYWGVPLTQFYPWHTLINQALAAGALPLWTDLLGNGAPLMANHQSALFYPPNLVFRLFPVEHAMGYSDLLHLIGAGLAAYFWGRTLGLGRMGATVTALCYGLGGYVVGRSQFVTMVAAYAWLPLLLALTERLLRRQGRFDLVWLGLALALQFLAGHAQTWFYSLLLVGGYGLYRIITLSTWRKPETGSWPVQLGRLALAFLLGLGLAAVQLLPTVQLALNSQRNSGADWDFAMTYSFWPPRLLTLLVPNLFGSPALHNYQGYANYWEDVAYIGVLPLIFALSAVIGWCKWRLEKRRSSAGSTPAHSPSAPRPAQYAIPFFALLLPLSLLLAMGKNTPIFPLVFEYLPGFGFFQAPARLMLWFALGASTLAGIGAHSFRMSHAKQYTLRLTLAGAGAMLVVGLVLSSGGLAPADIYLPSVTRLAVTLAVACGLLLLRGREPDDSDDRVRASVLPRPAWNTLVPVLVGVDLLIFGLPLVPSAPADIYQASDQPLHSVIAGSDTRLYLDPDYQYDQFFRHYFQLDSFGPSDPGHWQGLRDSLLPNLSAVDGVPSTANNEPLVIGRWRTLMDEVAAAGGATQARLLRLMNVGFVFSNQAGPGLSPVAQQQDLYRLADPMPRAWLVAGARQVSAESNSLAQLADPEFDPAYEVLLEEAADSSSASLGIEENSAGSSHPGTVTSLHEGWNSRTIDLTLSQPGYLVLAYTYYPGWQVTIDGLAGQLLRANYAFMAVPVQPGEHRIMLRYRPRSLLWGALITGLSLVLAAGFVVISRLGSENR